EAETLRVLQAGKGRRRRGREAGALRPCRQAEIRCLGEQQGRQRGPRDAPVHRRSRGVRPRTRRRALIEARIWREGRGASLAGAPRAGLTLGEPLSCRRALTLRAVAVAAGNGRRPLPTLSGATIYYK